MEPQDDRRAMYAYFGILAAFKLFTLVAILIYMSSWETIVFVVVSHVMWIAVGAVLVAGPATFWARLIRMRSRRRQLLLQEWHRAKNHTRPRTKPRSLIPLDRRETDVAMLEAASRDGSL